MLVMAMVRGRGGGEVQITFHGKRNDNFTFYSAIISSGFDVKINRSPFTETKYSILVPQIIKASFSDLFISE